MIRIGIQKNGHISNESLNFLSRKCLRITRINQLVFEDDTKSFQVLLLKYKDILPILKKGIIDCGIVGSENIIEQRISKSMGYKNLNFGALTSTPSLYIPIISKIK